MNDLLEIKIINDLTVAERLWKIFSPQETLYDSWDFRALFHKYHQHEIRFYVGYNDGVPVGLMPLQFNKNENYLEFWGGSYMEDNRVMVKRGYEHYIPEFYNFIQEKAVLQCIRGNDTFTTSLPIQDYKFVLTLKNFHSLEDYLVQSYSSETKKTILKKMRRIEREGINVIKNNFSDIELLFDFNLAQFQEYSSFADRPFHKEIFRELASPAFQPCLMTFEVGGVKQAVSLAVQYKNTYAYVLTGINPQGVKDLTTYVNIKNIEEAVNIKSENVDAFVGDYGWKERWHFEKISQHKFQI